jgi:predicted O-methyltransferase YrrM
MDFDADFLVGIPGGMLYDDNNDILFPWYTRSFLKELNTWNVKDWKIFEYGAGESTHWWRKKAKVVYSVDSNSDWADKTGSFFTDNKREFINYPIKFISDGKFDCIIIDGDPVEWRDDCTEIAISCCKKGGIIIIDNYNQGSVKLDNLPKTEKILKDKKHFIFSQSGHLDWKTAYWIV